MSWRRIEGRPSFAEATAGESCREYTLKVSRLLGGLVEYCYDADMGCKENIIAFGNLRKTILMETTVRYNLPFDSEYDWRARLTSTLTEIATRSIIDLVKQYEKDSQQIEWNNRNAMLWFAFEQNLFVKLKDEMIERARTQLEE